MTILRAYLTMLFIALSSWSSFAVSSTAPTEVYVDIDNDFIDQYGQPKDGQPKDGQFFGDKSYYYVGYEDFEIVSAPAFQKNFKPSEKTFISLPNEVQQFWIKINFLNKSSSDKDLFFFSNVNVPRELSIYENGLIKTFSHSESVNRRFIKLNLKANSTSTFYIKRYSDLYQRQDFSYWQDRKNLGDNITNLTLNWGIVITIFAMSLIFTVMLMISYRTSTYIHYGLYVVSFALMTTAGLGIFPIPYADHFINTTGVLAAIFVVTFSINFLNLTGYQKFFLHLVIALYVLSLLISFFDLSLGHAILSSGVIVGTISVFLFAIQLYIGNRELHVLIFIMAYGCVLVGTAVQILMLRAILPYTSGNLMYYSGAIENILMLLALAHKIYNTEKERVKNYEEISHSYAQLQKVFYPHQLTSMKKGGDLEDTMPVGSTEACVISFDIIDSSQIKSGMLKPFLREIFANCNNLMVKDYQENQSIDSIVSNGFRIKEMGDGLICSVGFPYRSPTGNSCVDALSLAEQFIAMFNQKVQDFNYTEPIYCGCGIAYGGVESFFPESTPVEYDMYGKAIVLACRYEAMRKVVLDRLGQTGNILIISESVYNSIDHTDREQFSKFDFEEHKVFVRDDPNATCLYYRVTQG